MTTSQVGTLNRDERRKVALYINDALEEVLRLNKKIEQVAPNAYTNGDAYRKLRMYTAARDLMVAQARDLERLLREGS